MKWTVNEVTFLRLNYPTLTKKEIENVLHAHAWRSIIIKAYQLGIKRGPARVRWTAEEVKYVQDQYPSGTRTDEIAKKLNRSSQAIRALALQLNLRRRFQQFPMTQIRKALTNGGSLLGQLTESEKGYIAGIFDGEGSVGIHVFKKKDRKTPRLAWAVIFTLTTTDPLVIEWLKRRIPFVRTGSHAGYGPNRKRIYRLTFSTFATIKFCQEIGPYLVTKKAEAELVASNLKDGFAPLTEKERFDLRLRLSNFKTKGPILRHPR